MIIGTAGHIDHGKTALVRALTGVDTDRLPEEKRRGITIDLGFAPLVLEGVGTVSVVDVPGHESFVRTMLAGASGIDVALVVVAADEGVMPQTREHVDIIALLQIPAAVVAVTKCDLVDVDWRDLVIDDVRALLGSTAYSQAEIVGVSSLDGSGIDELREKLVHVMQRFRRRQSASGPFRMPVDRVFSVKGTGTVVTGTVWDGTVERDATVRIEPGGKTVRVRGIQSHSSQLDRAQPGSRAALALAGCEVADITRGKTIVAESEWIASHRIDAVIEITSPDFVPTPRTRVRLHLGTADVGARLSRLRSVGSDRIAVRLVLEEPIIARGQDRLVLRAPSPARTVGGGVVTDTCPRRRSIPRGEMDAAALMLALLESEGPDGESLARLSIRSGLSPGAVLAALKQNGAVIIGSMAWASVSVAGLETFVEGFVESYAANHPLEDGVSLQTLRAAARASQQVMDYVVDRLINTKKLELSASLVRPHGWVAELGDADKAVRDAILHEICNQPLEPPGVAELAARFGRSTLALLRRLEREGEVERVSDDRFYACDAVSRMVGALRALEQGRTYTPAELRGVLGVSRKYLIPFLEFCDRKGVTQRTEEGRSVTKY